MFDIIGDIHGHAQALEALLAKLGYRHQGGSWRHPERRALFLGDLIDRGPQQLQTLQIVRSMLDADQAEVVMGNHEFNAIGLATPDPQRPGEYLRPRSAKNLHQQAAFIREIPLDSPLHQEWVQWFKAMPLYYDGPELRAIHACWHAPSLAILAPCLDERLCILDAALPSLFQSPGASFEALETVLKGPEMHLPEGVEYHDKDGVARHATRIRWWQQDADSLRTLALLPAHLCATLPDTPLEQARLIRYDNQRPLFFGHYWFQGEPSLPGPHVACLDYSIGKGQADGKLCAYRWDGDRHLSASNFVWVQGQPPV